MVVTSEPREFWNKQLLYSQMCPSFALSNGLLIFSATTEHAKQRAERHRCDRGGRPDCVPFAASVESDRFPR